MEPASTTLLELVSKKTEANNVMNLTKLTQVLRTRIATLTRWVNRHCPDCETEQAHLEEGTREQAYWNYGYLVALRDILRKVSGSRT
jgi:hypothetical protein